MNSDQLSRRDVLKLTGGAALTTAALAGCGSGASPNTTAPAARRRTARPRNIILMVSDGMSAGVPSMAEPFSQIVRQRGTRWHALMRDRDAAHGLLATESLSSMVTDSAAAASAWGSGSKVANGALNTTPDGKALTPLATMLKRSGVRVGLVTTDEMTGATPAGFAAASETRYAYASIAEQYLDRVDVLLGGGRRQFDPLAREDGRDLFDAYGKAGYAYRGDRDTLLASETPAKLLGLFAEERMPFTIDHRASPALRRSTPTLAEMTRAALRSLGGGAEGFFLMVEAARVDHAAHANDAAGMLWDQLAFDDAVAAALTFAEAREDTLVIVTSDHGNANPGLNGMGSGYNDSTAAFHKLAAVNASFAEVHRRITERRAGGGPAAAVILEEALGLVVTEDESVDLALAVHGDMEPTELHDQHRNWRGVLGQLMANHVGVGWTGVSHTSDHVIATAKGPGAEAIAGLHHHTELHDLLAAAHGVRA